VCCTEETDESVIKLCSEFIFFHRITINIHTILYDFFCGKVTCIFYFLENFRVYFENSCWNLSEDGQLIWLVLGNRYNLGFFLILPYLFMDRYVKPVSFFQFNIFHKQYIVLLFAKAISRTLYLASVYW